VNWLERASSFRDRPPTGPPPIPTPGESSRSAGDIDKAGFEAAALDHAGALYRTALHLAGNAFEAEDLVQETYLRAYRGFAVFRGGDLRAWLFAILRHAFLDECRRRGRTPIAEIDTSEIALEAFGVPAPSAEYEALRRLPSEAIERAFAELPQEWRMIVILADVEEFSYREIAAIMGVPLGTVMSRLHRARKRLRDHLLESPRSIWRTNERSA
jgi:RNA polymerase sigma-70 factor (ECF subfamily)